ncbi:MAG: GldG family protein [Patescibacteria group bacterium]
MTIKIKKIISRFRTIKLWATSLNLIGAILLVNLIATFVPVNLDLSSNRVNSLSPASREIAQQLDDVVNIKVFVSSNLPSQLLPAQETLKNILNQYQKANGKQVKLQWLDPQQNQEVENEAVSLGITPLQFSSTEKDQFQVVQGYFGLAILYQGQHQVIPALQEINNIEYQISASLKRLQNREIPQIAFDNQHQEVSQSDTKQIGGLLQDNYQVSQLSWDQDQTSNNYKTIVLTGPQTQFSSKETDQLDQYLNQGKGVLILLDQVLVDANLQTQKAETGLENWLTGYGIQLGNKLVLDQSSAFTSFQTPQGSFIIPYPFWIQTRPENSSHDNPVTSSIESVVFPWSGFLTLSQGAQTLLSTSQKNTTTDNFQNIFPGQDWDFTKDQPLLPLAAIQTKNPKNQQPIKLAVVADADFIKDSTLVAYPENAQFFLNLVDYLSQDTQLIQIRSKTVFSRPLKNLDVQQKQLIKIINISVGPIILLSLFGLTRLARKKHHEV